MTIDDLPSALDAAGIPRDAYLIDSVAGDNVSVLYREAPDRWLTFYLERGQRRDVRRFPTEAVACEAFVAQLADLFRRAGRHSPGI